MDKSELEKLFAETLKGKYDDNEPWEAVHKLRNIGSRDVFEIAKIWCQSPSPQKRARGADVLAQIGRNREHHNNAFPEESYAVVSELLTKETEVRPISSAIFALGHIDNPSAIPSIIKYAMHSDSEIRFAVACALGSFPDEPVSAKHLLDLMSDVDEDVRDWATFGLGVLGSMDTPEIREALYLRLNDTFEDARLEAVAGLGKRKDQRVVRPLLQLLEQPEVPYAAIEAAYQLLGMNEEKKSWGAADYAAAIHKTFLV